MKKATKTTKRQMSIRAYRAKLTELLDGTTPAIASEVCFKLWDEYISNGIYLDPEYVKADIACAEGHLTNPPPELPEIGVDLNPGSKIFVIYHYCDDQQRGCLFQTEMRVAKHLTATEMLQHKKKALSLIRLFGRYNPYFGRRGIHA